MGRDIYDIFVIGGGINGCGIARDAAGRGYTVGLAEQADLASGTSSAATKLIHGGLRYLEYYEFRLVREALTEREVLWAAAPHIVWPLRFVLPHRKGLRPAWLIRLGLFLYDHLGGRKLLPATRVLDMRAAPAAAPLKPGFAKAFEYSDCWVNDARLVVLNAMDAAARGADIFTRTKVVGARPGDGYWTVTLRTAEGTERTVSARMIVNAAGPWVDHVLDTALGHQAAHNVRLVRGSHIVVNRKYEGAHAYFFQNPDGRIMFAIPYEGDYTLIGTTDNDFEGDPADAAITDTEIDYLIAGADEYFAEPVRRDDIVWTYSGVRPLFDDGASEATEATREYILRLEREEDGPVLLNIFGGKLTTYRRLAEEALGHVGRAIGTRGKPWTATADLPGGEFGPLDFETELDRLHADYPFLASTHARRLFRLYGTRARHILGEARTHADLGQHLGADLTEVEIAYLVQNEWARTADDILWRRTKRGLEAGQIDIKALEQVIGRYC